MEPGPPSCLPLAANEMPYGDEAGRHGRDASGAAVHRRHATRNRRVLILENCHRFSRPLTIPEHNGMPLIVSTPSAGVQNRLSLA